MVVSSILVCSLSVVSGVLFLVLVVWTVVLSALMCVRLGGLWLSPSVVTSFSVLILK